MSYEIQRESESIGMVGDQGKYLPTKCSVCQKPVRVIREIARIGPFLATSSSAMAGCGFERST